jgi:hypothetical protein
LLARLPGYRGTFFGEGAAAGLRARGVGIIVFVDA